MVAIVLNSSLFCRIVGSRALTDDHAVGRLSTVRGRSPSPTLGSRSPTSTSVNDVTSWSHRTESRRLGPRRASPTPRSPRTCSGTCATTPSATSTTAASTTWTSPSTRSHASPPWAAAPSSMPPASEIGRDLAGAPARSARHRRHTSSPGPATTSTPRSLTHVVALTADEIAERILADSVTARTASARDSSARSASAADSRRPSSASLRGALLAQRETGLPMQVHLPGWFRRGDTVPTSSRSYGVDPAKVVLCHMGPSGEDLRYQEPCSHAAPGSSTT